MTSQYNLRSSSRKASKKLCCCQEKLFQSQLINEINPIVELKRLKVLENPDYWSSKFYFCQGKVVVKKKAGGFSTCNKKKCVKFLFTILVLSTLIYFKADVQQHFSSISVSLMKRTESFYESAKTFFINLKQLLEKLIEKGMRKKLLNEFSRSEIEKGMLKNNNTNIELEIKRMVRANLEEFNKCNLKEVIKPISILEEQCEKREVYEKVNNYSYDSNDLSQKQLISLILVDYALELKGAKILSTFDTKPYGIITLRFWNYEFEIQNFFLQKFFNSRGPTSVLVPWTKPGDCWAFKGTHGRILIELSDKIIVSAITVDHIRSDLLPKNSIQSAPRKFSATGIVKDNGHVSNRIHLGSFEYKSSGPLSQTFLITPKLEISIKVIEFNFESNHGNNEYTCVYKIRVHGYVPNI